MERVKGSHVRTTGNGELRHSEAEPGVAVRWESQTKALVGVCLLRETGTNPQGVMQKFYAIVASVFNAITAEYIESRNYGRE